jgi:flagellar motor switch/type III secretory pathway protein FliN
VSLTDIERGLVDAALDDLGRRILGIDRLRTHDIQFRDADDGLSDLLGPGESGVYCELAIGGIPLSVLLSPQGLRCVWSRQAAPSPEVATTHVRDALGNLNSGNVGIRAQLPSAEMTIADLASMNVGDVIHLSARSDEHIAVQVGDSPHTLLANLGLACGSRALQIVGVASQEKNKQITSN